jgi:hypothetical protein
MVAICRLVTDRLTAMKRDNAIGMEQIPGEGRDRRAVGKSASRQPEMPRRWRTRGSFRLVAGFDFVDLLNLFPTTKSSHSLMASSQTLAGSDSETPWP